MIDEEIQKFSDPILTLCKGCEIEGGVNRLMPGQMNFILKGDGWYKDGYSSKKDEPKTETVTSKMNTATKKQEVLDIKETPRAER